jgi:hypothetical protein
MKIETIKGENNFIHTPYLSFQWDFSHPRRHIVFQASSINMKIGIVKSGILQIASHLDPSFYLANQE